MRKTGIIGSCLLCWIAFPGALLLAGGGGCVTKAASVYVVEIDDTCQPVFPQKCAACARIGSEMPAGIHVGDEQGRVDYYLYGFQFSPSQGPLLTIPIHDSCAKAIRNDFLKRLALILLLAAAIIAMGFYLRHGLIGIIAAAIVATLFLSMQMMKPVPFEFYKTPNSYVLIFANPEYAREFASRNGATVEKCEYSGAGIPVKTEEGRKE